MTFKPWVAAAALTVFSMAAQAASSFGALGPGDYALDIALSNPADSLLNEQVSFSLKQGSRVTGTLTGVTGAQVSYREFTEAGGYQNISANMVNDGSSASFDLGALRGGLSFDPTSYNLQLRGFVSTPGVTSLRMTLSVSAVPEVSTWSTLALGLVGMAAVRRRAASSQA